MVNSKQDAMTIHHKHLVEVYGLERKLQPQLTIKFAEKSPKFVAVDKHTIVYEK